MEELQSISCEKCGCPDFDYDNSWKEYSCKNCGWIVKDENEIKVIKTQFHTEQEKNKLERGGDKRKVMETRKESVPTSEKNQQLSQESKDRLMLGSNPSVKEIRMKTAAFTPNLDIFPRHLAALLDPERSDQKAGEFGHLIMHVIVGVIIAALGTVCFFIIWPSYSKSSATIPGATALLSLGGLAGMIGGVGYILWRIFDYFKGANLSDPEKAIKSFVSSIDDGNYSRAWNCMTPIAQGDMKSIQDFKTYCKKLKKYLNENVPLFLKTKPNVNKDVSDAYSATVMRTLKAKNIAIEKSTENTAILTYDLSVKQIRSITRLPSNKDMGAIVDGRVIYPQITAVVKHGDSWYLIGGFLYGPEIE